jgi:hypothetical protein
MSEVSIVDSLCQQNLSMERLAAKYTVDDNVVTIDKKSNYDFQRHEQENN